MFVYNSIYNIVFLHVGYFVYSLIVHLVIQTFKAIFPIPGFVSLNLKDLCKHDIVVSRYAILAMNDRILVK